MPCIGKGKNKVACRAEERGERVRLAPPVKCGETFVCVGRWLFTSLHEGRGLMAHHAYANQATHLHASRTSSAAPLRLPAVMLPITVG